MSETTSTSGGLPEKTDDVVRTWAAGALKATGRHAAACDHFERLDSRLGLASTVLAAIVGSTVFISLQQTTALGVKVGAGVLGLAAAVLSAIQTSAKFGARSERHRQASRHYGALVREIEEFRALPASPTDLPAKLDALRKSFDDAGLTAPDVPPKIWDHDSRGRVTALSVADQVQPRPDGT